jgi:hypothetical protein
MKNALSGNKRSLHGLAEILAQAPRVVAAFGNWPRFVLMLITIFPFHGELGNGHRDQCR